MISLAELSQSKPLNINRKTSEASVSILNILAALLSLIL